MCGFNNFFKCNNYIPPPPTYDYQPPDLCDYAVWFLHLPIVEPHALSLESPQQVFDDGDNDIKEEELSLRGEGRFRAGRHCLLQ